MFRLLLRLFERGIGFHHAGLSMVEKGAVEVRFSSKNFPLDFNSYVDDNLGAVSQWTLGNHILNKHFGSGVCFSGTLAELNPKIQNEHAL